MADKYVRLSPYNKKTGALARRFTIGSRTFVGGEWYVLPQSWCDKLVDLNQESGAPFFQILDEAGFRKVTQKEMVAAMTAAGLQGLALNAPIDLPKVKAPKAGPSPSKFDGLAKESAQVDLASPESVTKAQEKVEAANEDMPSAEDVLAMDESALLDAVEDLNMDIDPEAGPDAMREAVLGKLSELAG